MTDDSFMLIERDETGRPKVQRMLDPREVSIVYDEDGTVVGYLWEPADGEDA